MLLLYIFINIIYNMSNSEKSSEKNILSSENKTIKETNIEKHSEKTEKTEKTNKKDKKDKKDKKISNIKKNIELLRKELRLLEEKYNYLYNKDKIQMPVDLLYPIKFDGMSMMLLGVCIFIIIIIFVFISYLKVDKTEIETKSINSLFDINIDFYIIMIIIMIKFFWQSN